jgi:hypothetical protein
MYVPGEISGDFRIENSDNALLILITTRETVTSCFTTAAYGEIVVHRISSSRNGFKSIFAAAKLPLV